jgi:hypothetical protein
MTSRTPPLEESLWVITVRIIHQHTRRIAITNEDVPLALPSRLKKKDQDIRRRGAHAGIKPRQWKYEWRGARVHEQRDVSERRFEVYVYRSFFFFFFFFL